MSAYTLYFQKLESFSYIFVADSMGLYLYLNFCSGLQKTHLFCNWVRIGRSRSPKVDMIFVPIESVICDFPLVGHCDMVLSGTVSAYFSYPSLIRRPRSLCSLWNFAVTLTMRKLESRLSFAFWLMCQRVTDGRTDRETDGFTIASTAQAMLTRCKNVHFQTILTTNTTRRSRLHYRYLSLLTNLLNLLTYSDSDWWVREPPCIQKVWGKYRDGLQDGERLWWRHTSWYITNVTAPWWRHTHPGSLRYVAIFVATAARAVHAWNLRSRDVGN